MSWGFHRSVTLGGVRFKFSRSGISTSLGGRGFRVSRGPRGVYVTTGAHGFYYRQRVFEYGPQEQPVHEPSMYAPEGDVVTYRSASLGLLSDVSQEEFVRGLNEWTHRGGLQALFALAALLIGYGVFSLAPQRIVEVLLYLGIVYPLVRHIEQQRRRFILVYDLSEKAEQEYMSLQALIADVAQSGSLKGVNTERSHSDWKRNAGATAALTFGNARIRRTNPPSIVTNIQPLALVTQDKELFFLPDRLLIHEGGLYAALAYDSIRVESVEGSFVWESPLPPDAQVIEMTWRFVRKDGGPDLRFSNNRQIPVVRVAYLSLESKTGLNVRVQATRVAAVHRMATRFALLATSSRQSATPPDAPPRVPPQVLAALATLGLDTIPSATVLKDAYRDLAKRNHPDKFSQAPADVRAFAEERMKEINAANQVLASLVQNSPVEPVDSEPEPIAPESSSLSPSSFRPVLSAWPVAGAALACLVVFAFFHLGTGVSEPQPDALRVEQMVNLATDSGNEFQERMFNACQVRSSPSSTGTVLGNVDRGDPIRIVEQQRGWRNIATPSGLRGWTGPRCWRSEK